MFATLKQPKTNKDLNTKDIELTNVDSIKEYSTYIFCYLTEEHFFAVVFVKENDIAKFIVCTI